MTIKLIANNARQMGAGALFCLIFLAGCSALPAPPISPAVYDFGPGLAPAPSAAPAPVGATARAPLALEGIESVGLSEGGRALQYRLAYDDPQQLRAYQRARWSQPPAQLLQQAVSAELGQHRPVLAAGAARAAAREGQAGLLVLRLELEEFSQVFASPTQSEGLVRLRATLAQPSPQGERLRGQRVFAVRHGAPSADAAGGSAALAQAAQQVARDLAQWVDQNAP